METPGARAALDRPREVPIHRSLVRPNLVAGAERELVILNGVVAMALVFGIGISWITALIAGLQLTLGHFALVQAARYEPLFRKVYVRHVRHRPAYPARSSVHARPGFIHPTLGGSPR